MTKNAVVGLSVVGWAFFAVAGFAFYNSTRPTWRNAGVKHQRQDHNGKTVNTEECPILLGVRKDVCVIKISYLQGMMAPGQDETAIEVHPKDTIVWVGDQGETIDKVTMPGKDCSDHRKDDKPDAENTLIDQLSGTGSLKFSHVSDKNNHLRYCYKTTVTVTLNGKQIDIDPHTFDGSDSP